VLGTGPAADVRLTDPSVARYHAVVRVSEIGAVAVESLAAPLEPAGVARRSGDTIALGRTRAVVTAVPAAPPLGPPSPNWRVLFHRPPRPLPPPVPLAVVVPEIVRATGRPAALGWAGAVTGIAAGVGVSLLLHNPLMLAMSAVGATGSLASAVALRRRHRHDVRATERTTAQALARFTADLAASHAVHLVHRRAAVTELDDAVARALAADARVWERRPGHADAFEMLLGHGDEPWEPSLDGPAPAPGSPLGPALATHLFLNDVPVTTTLAPGAVLGLAGPSSVTHSVARSLVIQLAVHHGPADLAIGVATASDRVKPWRWVEWLPHAVTVGCGEAIGEQLGEHLGEMGGPRHAVLITDDPSLFAGRTTAARRLVADRGAAVVVADRIDDLPSVCTEVIELTADGRCRSRRVDGRTTAGTLQLVGASSLTAAAAARALARLDDPEHEGARHLPSTVRLLELIGAEALEPDGVVTAWAAHRHDGPRAPIGVAADGVVEIDLERDGPHTLVVGTTGAGKSELLRTLVVALAARCRPDDVSFVLIDYKGGSAFDACADLPHVVGVLTDLDDHLAGRALRSLDAELKRRERLLRDADAVDLAAYRAAGAAVGLARLVVVVDEFASLAAELPEFLTALVGVAQRGRSLGVHLVLASQRAAGALRDDIRANTNCRVALRMHTAAESIDVIGAPDAASIPRRRPGQACVRLGPGELVTLQTALVSRAGPPTRRPSVVVWGRGDDPPAPQDGATDLARLVTAIAEAARRLDVPAPHRPWCDPLPAEVALADLPGGAMVLADEPDEQRQRADRWAPERGHLVVVGPAGSGRSNALATAALALAGMKPADELHMYVLDLGSGALVALAGLPHCGAVVRAGDEERCRRLLRWLGGERRRRLAAAPGEHGPAILVAVDGVGALAALANEPGGHELLDVFAALVADGASIGIHLAVSAERVAAVSPALAASAGERWLLARADHEGDIAGSNRRPPGRAVDSAGRDVQIASVLPLVESVRRLVASSSPPARRPHRIGALPTVVDLADLPSPATSTGVTYLTIGIGDDDLAAVSLPLHAGDHAVVSGPARSGKSCVLAALATQVRLAHPGALLIGVCPRASPMRGHPALDRWCETLGTDALVAPYGRLLFVFVDDAERVEGLEPLLVLADSHVLAAATADALRAAYGHWTQRLRRSRLGVLLRPDLDLDGELLGVSLPRRPPVAPLPGRGYLVHDGRFEMVQCAQPILISADRDTAGAHPRRE
jgi:S-DNA-T family DNA segregation ATPase FtsK/SpoIIIE